MQLQHAMRSRLKSNAEWEALSHLERVLWCDRLAAPDLVAQAEIRAAAAHCSARQILDAWLYNGYISQAARAQARALEG